MLNPPGLSGEPETKLHYEPVGEPVDMKQAITPEVKAQCEALGKAMAEKLLAE